MQTASERPETRLRRTERLIEARAAAVEELDRAGAERDVALAEVARNVRQARSAILTTGQGGFRRSRASCPAASARPIGTGQPVRAAISTARWSSQRFSDSS